MARPPKSHLLTATMQRIRQHTLTDWPPQLLGIMRINVNHPGEGEGELSRESWKT